MHLLSNNTVFFTSWFDEGDIEMGLKITAFLLLLVVSLLGNCLLIAIVYKNANQRMRTPSNYFVFNMACADILLVVYCVPLNVITTAYRHRWLISGFAGELVCRMSLFIGQVPVFVSTGSLFVIALDRYFLVFYPRKRLITLRIARRLIGLVWILAIAFSAPLLRMSTLVKVYPGDLACFMDFEIIHFAVAYFLSCYPVLIAVPLIATIAMYIGIGIKLNRTKAPGNQLPSNQERRERMNHKILTTLVAVVVALIICRLPLIFGLTSCFLGLARLCATRTFMTVAWIMTVTNTGINPCIYFVLNNQFRQGARLFLEEKLPCCFKATNEVDVMEADAL